MTETAWIVSYPRSGAYRVQMLLAAHLLDAPITTVETLYDVLPDFVELFHRGRTLPADGTGPVAAKTQFLPDAEVLRPFQPTTAKVVYVIRDPREVLLSTLRYMRVPQDGRAAGAKTFIAHRGDPHAHSMGRGFWPEHVRAWTSGDQAARHVVRFEDLQRDPAGTLAGIAAFLDVPGAADLERARRAAERCTREAVGKAEAVQLTQGVKPFRKRPPEFPDEPGPTTLLEIGPDIEAEYQRALKEDEDFASLVSRYGYADAASS